MKTHSPRTRFANAHHQFQHQRNQVHDQQTQKWGEKRRAHE